MPELDTWATPEIRPREFAQIKAFAYETFGLDLREGRERLVCCRLGKHLRAGGFKSFEEYFRYVQSDRSGEALVSLIDALTTNHTSFLREREHFDFLTTTILPGLRGRREMAIWSAACSTGEEPYSILFSVREVQRSAPGPELRLAATDISTKVLAIATEGIYPKDRLIGLPPAWISTYFDRIGAKEQERFRVKAPLRACVTFRRMNLMDPFPAHATYTVIFCRNVMIYFNKATQTKLVNRLAERLEPGGYLFVGHAESLTGIDHPLKYVRPAIYRKPV